MHQTEITNNSGESANQVEPPPLPKVEHLLSLINLHNSNRIDYNTRKWETIKFFESVYTVLIGTTIVALMAALKDHRSEPYFGILLIAISGLPTSATIAVILGFVNLRRESRLLFVEELQMFKLARLAGFDVSVAKDKRWLAEDEYLLPEKWRLNKYATRGANPTKANSWINARLQGHKFNDLFRLLFLLEAGVGLIMTIATLFLISYPK